MVRRAYERNNGQEDLAVLGDFAVRSYRVTSSLEFESTVYVVYGGSGVSGGIELSSLPSLTELGVFGGRTGIVAVGDVDGARRRWSRDRVVGVRAGRRSPAAHPPRRRAERSPTGPSPSSASSGRSPRTAVSTSPAPA
jgi:hypothetical protein